MEVWPACVTGVDTTHIMSIFNHVCELNIKGLTCAIARAFKGVH